MIKVSCPIFLNERVFIGLRVVTTAVSGYFLAMVVCLLLNKWLALPERDSRLLTEMVFYIVYLLVILWMFAVSSHKKAIVSINVLTAGLWLVWWSVGMGVA